MEGLSFAWKELCFESLCKVNNVNTLYMMREWRHTRVKGVPGLLAEIRVS